LEIVCRIELSQQGGMHLLAADPQIRDAVDAVADRRSDRNGDRRRSRFGGGRDGRSDQRNRVSRGGRDGRSGQHPGHSGGAERDSGHGACRIAASAGKPASVKQDRLA